MIVGFRVICKLPVLNRSYLYCPIIVVRAGINDLKMLYVRSLELIHLAILMIAYPFFINPGLEAVLRTRIDLNSIFFQIESFEVFSSR